MVAVAGKDSMVVRGVGRSSRTLLVVLVVVVGRKDRRGGRCRSFLRLLLLRLWGCSLVLGCLLAKGMDSILQRVGAGYVLGVNSLLDGRSTFCSVDLRACGRSI